uniref:G_PROTEIN_RECEP_F1_2 domain-containing protein n=1 Tax=Ascaris lumbricoides TaxID=6252 RepID=A0A0M3I3D2_ASCLU
MWPRLVFVSVYIVALVLGTTGNLHVATIGLRERLYSSTCAWDDRQFVGVISTCEIEVSVLTIDVKHRAKPIPFAYL